MVLRRLSTLKCYDKRLPECEKRPKPDFERPHIKQIPQAEINQLRGTKQLLDEQGPKAVADWLLKQDDVLITDTTFRDAHQSLLATRVRTNDILAIASETAEILQDAFSLEMWGGATFDVAYNFLKTLGKDWKNYVQRFRMYCSKCCCVLLMQWVIKLSR